MSLLSLSSSRRILGRAASCQESVFHLVKCTRDQRSFPKRSRPPTRRP
ncbi:hypothetical protein ABIC94_002846 [Variovorax paradoxus]